jgi:hypothetical protein
MELMRILLLVAPLIVAALTGCGRSSMSLKNSFQSDAIANAPNDDYSIDDESQQVVPRDLQVRLTEVAPGEFFVENNANTSEFRAILDAKTFAAVLATAPKDSPKQTSKPEPSIPVSKPIAKPDSKLPAKQPVQPKLPNLNAKKLKISERLLKEALLDMDRVKSRVKNKRYIAIADFSQSSAAKRFYVIDLQKGELVLNTHVSHGKGSGNKLHAINFLNDVGSNATALGTYVTTTAYKGEHGASLKLDGLSETNSNAMKRNIVIHGASYVPLVDEFGKFVVRPLVGVGRSQGCFAMSYGANKKVLQILGSGAFLYAGLSDPKTAKVIR